VAIADKRGAAAAESTALPVWTHQSTVSYRRRIRMTEKRNTERLFG